MLLRMFHFHSGQFSSCRTKGPALKLFWWCLSMAKTIHLISGNLDLGRRRKERELGQMGNIQSGCASSSRICVLLASL